MTLSEPPYRPPANCLIAWQKMDNENFSNVFSNTNFNNEKEVTTEHRVPRAL